MCNEMRSELQGVMGARGGGRGVASMCRRCSGGLFATPSYWVLYSYTDCDVKLIYKEYAEVKQRPASHARWCKGMSV